MSEQTKSIYDLEEFKPHKDRWDTRQTELSRRKSYYTGAVYQAVRRSLANVVGHYAHRLYKGIKPLYLPLARAVDVDAGIIPGGWPLLDQENENSPLVQAKEIVFGWSRWRTEGVLYVHYGAQMGISGLKVSDLRQENDRRVIIQPVDPLRFMLVGSSAFDDTPAMSIFVEERQDVSGEEIEYAEVTTPESIRIFVNGELSEFDGYGPEEVNDLGFVPYVEVQHMRTGAPLGECTFQKSIEMLDETNQLASYLADMVKKHSEPQWLMSGAEPSDLEKSGDNVWFVPAGGGAEALVAQIDVTGVLEFIRELAKNVKDSLPELSFDELREKSQIATATLELQLMELVLKIKRSRPNYDEGLERALRLAGRAAATMNIGEVSVLDTPELEIDPDRPVLPLDPMTEIDLEMQTLALERERAGNILEGELDY